MIKHPDVVYKMRRSILISYGAVVATMMLVCVGLDSLLTGSTEIWYVDASYMVITSIAVFVAGVVLLKAFEDKLWLQVSLGTSLAIWPTLALLQFGLVPLLGVFFLNINLMYAVFVAVFAAIASVPSLVCLTTVKIMRIELEAT